MSGKIWNFATSIEQHETFDWSTRLWRTTILNRMDKSWRLVMVSWVLNQIYRFSCTIVIKMMFEKGVKNVRATFTKHLPSRWSYRLDYGVSQYLQSINQQFNHFQPYFGWYLTIIRILLINGNYIIYPSNAKNDSTIISPNSKEQKYWIEILTFDFEPGRNRFWASFVRGNTLEHSGVFDFKLLDD